ncbi:general substrate transporter [Myriangium duriaei CBS 260.36]|uniref:General substrate transporter n=1 Tax=Myriangium duriaei CBS 260.36 TaxID=1168546 RepID=A0A9P4IW88_9PEZI|nr:general substrate transporter [Myriangium duriaei CBS 260.36]
MAALYPEKKFTTDEHIENADDGHQSIDVTALSGIEATATSRAAWLISITVSIGGFLFGYDTGYISSVLVTIGTSLGHNLSSNEQELVTSLTSGGALVGAICAGTTADRFGRKMPIWAACATFVLGTLLQAAAYSLAQFAVGRFIVGLGVGSAAMIVPLYIGELAPAKYRGRMIAFNNMSVTLGQLIASAIGAGFAHVKGEGWRATVAIGGLPPLVLAGLLLMCPESPRQLVAHGRIHDADTVLTKLYKTSTAEQRQAKIRSIEMSIHEATATMAGESLWTSFKRIFNTPATGRAVLTACIVMAISQLGGFNTLIPQRATLFKLVGFSNATAVAITVSGTNFVFSIVNLVLVDRYGRRILLCVTVLGMSICMLLAAISFHWIPINHDLVLETNNVGWPGIVVLITIIVYVACFSSGVATIAWIGTELIPMEVRALGTMLNTVTCWSTNIIISSTFLSMMKGMTPSGAFGFYAGICFVGWLFIVLLYPDVKGMPLETIREVFQDGFGLKYSKRWQRENKDSPKVVEATFGH